MKTLLGILAVLLVILIIIFFSRNFLGKNFLAIVGKSPQITINNQTLHLLEAKNEKDKEVGLSGRPSLPEDNGMLFPFDKPGYYAFWMKDMRFPLDIIFLKDKHVVTIFKNIPPPKSANEQLPVYKPTEPVDMVLEINAGKADKLGIKQGDTLNIAL